jgi:hypothetical protein
MVPRMRIWKHPCAMIFFHMLAVIRLSFLLIGSLFKSSSDGGSVARAKEARVSMIRLTHNIWMGFRGDSLKTAPPTKAMIRATKLTVSWNCRNFLMQSKMFLPHFMAVTIEAKLSSRRMMPEASFAT